VLGWWLAFTQTGLSPARTNTLYSAHSYTTPTKIPLHQRVELIIEENGIPGAFSLPGCIG